MGQVVSACGSWVGEARRPGLEGKARTAGLTPAAAVESGSSLLPSRLTTGRWKESPPFRGARLEACLLPKEAPAAPFLWNPEPHMLSLSPTPTSPLFVQGRPLLPL